jgi:hypothetical protein
MEFQVQDGTGRRLQLSFTVDALEISRIVQNQLINGKNHNESIRLKYLWHYRMIYQVQTQRQQRTLIISSRDFKRQSLCFEHSQAMELFAGQLNERIRSRKGFEFK